MLYTFSKVRELQEALNLGHRGVKVKHLGIVTVLVLLLWPLAILLHGFPPDFQDVKTYERGLPQHHRKLLDLERMQAKQDATAQSPRMLALPGHVVGRGFNNVLQEAILFAHLAALTQRAYVFDDWIWSHTWKYRLSGLALQPARIPLNAFVKGPLSGSRMPETNSSVPRAVSTEYYELVCPPEDRVSLSMRDSGRDVVQGDVLIAYWVDQINKYEGVRCLEIGQKEEIVFDHLFFGSSRILSTWPLLSTSPVMARFAWSPLVISAILRNFAIFPGRDDVDSTTTTYLGYQPSSREPMILPRATSAAFNDAALPGLLAVHIRRGDYKSHCRYLEKHKFPYIGWSQLPDFVDRFDPLHPSKDHSSLDHYLEHCLPDVQQIVARLHHIREEHNTKVKMSGGTPLARVYALTNERGAWMKRLQDGLANDGWSDTRASSDLVLDEEQRYVDMAVDMAIAERSEVFVGNGFSSLSSNIAMLRRASGIVASSSRFL